MVITPAADLSERVPLRCVLTAFGAFTVGHHNVSTFIELQFQFLYASLGGAVSGYAVRNAPYPLLVPGTKNELGRTYPAQRTVERMSGARSEVRGLKTPRTFRTSNAPFGKLFPNHFGLSEPHGT